MIQDHQLICPITGSNLIHIGCEHHVMDPDQWYSPESDKTIIYARHPFSWTIFRLIERPNMMEKALRYFKLNDDNTWTELKRVPNGNNLFPLDDFGDDWQKACEEGLERLAKRKAQEEYWKEHPEEDPRIFAKTVSIELIEVKPMDPPSMLLNFFDFKYKD